MVSKTFFPLSNRFAQLLDDALMGSDGESFAPPCNIVETDQEYLLEVDLPGFTAEQVQVEFEDGRLTISGERTFQRQEEHKYHRVESRYGKFRRSFGLPRDVASGKIEAKFENGVLRLTAPKSEAAQPKRIEVR